jgi:hypothetical protein
MSKPRPPDKRREEAGVKTEVLEQLQRHLERLGLDELKSSLDGHLSWAQERKPSHAEFLERVLGEVAALKRERRVELAFENHRFWDLRRWKDAQSVLNQPIRGVRVTKNSSNAVVYAPFIVENRVFDGTKMYHHPMPQSEINKSAGVLKQNPGW